MKSKEIHSKLLLFQAFGFAVLILWSWLDEIFDLPSLLFGGKPSPANIVEAIEESIVITLFAIIFLFATHRLLTRIKLLEGIVPTCSFCKKVRVDDDWQQIEQYISTRSDAEFSHGFCPECMKKQYGIN